MTSRNKNQSYNRRDFRVSCHEFKDDAHLELALCERCAEGDDVLGCDLWRLGFVFGHLVLQGDEAQGRALFLLQAKELQDALVILHHAVDEDEEDLQL